MAARSGRWRRQPVADKLGRNDGARGELEESTMLPPPGVSDFVGGGECQNATHAAKQRAIPTRVVFGSLTLLLLGAAAAEYRGALLAQAPTFTGPEAFTPGPVPVPVGAGDDAGASPAPKPAVAGEGRAAKPVVLLGAHYYTVCNGLTNQLLGHAGNIATAIARKMPVMVPDVFIVDGVQWANQRGVYSNAKAVMDNSIPFSSVFNTSALLEKIRSFGVEAAVASYEESLDSPLDCTFLELLRGGDPAVIREILRVMAASPSAGAAAVVEDIMAALFAAAAEAQPWVSKETGVCLHHRDGADWHSHCDNWEPLPNSARNCHGRDRPLSELVQYRTSHIHGRWFLYAGDHDIPADLQSLGAPVLTREEVFDSSRHDLVARFTNKQFASVPRDLRAVLDYLTCFRLPYFIGNSVSTFSCGQILQRESNASWYNSGFIPLSEILQAYLLPIVYTFTEEGSAQRKSMLKVSILSVRRHMPAAAVYVLYHGSRDVGFRAWLVRQGVRLRDHRPPWRDKVERLRLAGQGPAGGPAVDGGDFFGRWQHIDIPFHVSVQLLPVAGRKRSPRSAVHHRLLRQRHHSDPGLPPRRWRPRGGRTKRRRGTSERPLPERDAGATTSRRLTPLLPSQPPVIFPLLLQLLCLLLVLFLLLLLLL
ncbi:unnamed protein product, partial [Prorocentrum cordatum]